MKKALILLLIILSLTACSLNKEQACINSGGTIKTTLCCKSTDDFPDTCAVGPCGCAPQNSHEIKTCDCGEPYTVNCFDGNTCTQRQTDEDPHCITESGKSMGLIQAKQIAVNSECGSRLKENSQCNADTGTWWIDLNIEKEGCGPACVINIETETASINWRCMGVIPE